jgi:plasmid stabilization system protein ParE
VASEYSVVVLARARGDVDAIYTWLRRRSPSGAVRWYTAFLQAANSLGVNPDRHGFAPESTEVGRAIHQKIFKTRSGRNYRMLFIIFDNEVRVLRVRGPGQPPLSSNALSGD